MNLSRKHGEEFEIVFEDLYSRFHHEVCGWVRLQVRNIEHSEEIAQEVFIKLYRSLETYDPTRPIKAWLRTLTKNAVTDWLRAQGTRSDAEAGAIEVMVIEESHIVSPGAEKSLLAQADTRALFRAVKKLPVLQRKVLLLRIFGGRSYSEISERLGVSLAAAKCAMYRARLILLAEWQVA